MAETLNMMSVTIETFIREVEMQLEEENYDPVIGIGKSGVGKTMSIAELCEKLKIGFCELRLVTLTEVDLLGIPTITPDGRTTYASNDLLPNEARDGEAGILVLDEITSATSTIRAAAYQLLDSKRALGNYKLPKKWKIVALGNGPDDGGVFSSMESAFLSRGVCYRIEPDLDCWKKWAVENGINPSITAFLTFDSAWFHKMDVDAIASIFPCPRSWTALSKMLNAREKRKGRALSENEVLLASAGAVGVEAATPFTTFYGFNDKVNIDIDTIIDGTCITESGPEGKRKFSVPYNIGDIEQQTMYITIQSVIKSLNAKINTMNIESVHDDGFKYISNVFKWILAIAEVRKDYAITALQDLCTVKNVVNLLIDTELRDVLPEGDDFLVDNSQIFE